jgi:hypothetical protein
MLRRLVEFARARLNPDRSGFSLVDSIRRLGIYAEAARRIGLDAPCLFLSFDCDTDLDAAAIAPVHEFLRTLGINATYAVPGAQLLKDPTAYRRLAKYGAEFMNHGGRPHAEFDGNRWVGTTFYDKMTPADVEADIRLGHAIVTEVIGAPPLGFRAPHFGCYQSPEQLALLHRTAAALGYRYCSTTLPSYGLAKGPAVDIDGMVEFPCFGSIRNLETILDSWTYLTDRTHYALGDDYFDLMKETVDLFVERRVPAILAWYADPCHVLDQPPFMRAMETIAKHGIPSYSGSELAARFTRAET